MDSKTLQLAFLKAQKQLNSLKGNQYSDKRLTEYQDQLFDLSKEVNKEFLDPSFNPVKDFQLLRRLIQFIEQSTCFLEDSTMNLIPFETVFCLQNALKDWTNDDYIIVTSLQDSAYFFQGFLSLNEQLFEWIEKNYTINFKHRLIQVGIPKHEVNNYLFSIVLYHELGHFIDRKFRISETIIAQYFLSESNRNSIYSHYMEYFADIFAAQYIGEYSSYVLNYLAFNARDSHTHPATIKRTTMMDTFLNGGSNPILTHLQTMTKNLTQKDLEKRYESIPSQNFSDLIPPIISNNKQLHGIFIMAWDTWLNKRDEFEALGLNLEKMDIILNNLVEKAISNYMVLKEWNKAKTHVSN